jgi:hypothetical protein
MSPSSSTRSAAPSWAGGSPARSAPSWPWTRWRWRSGCVGTGRRRAARTTRPQQDWPTVVTQRPPARVSPWPQLAAAPRAHNLTGPQPGLHRPGVRLYHLHTGAPRIDVGEAASISGQRFGEVAFSLFRTVNILAPATAS